MQTLKSSIKIIAIFENMEAMKGLAYCVVITTAAAILLQSIAFKRVSATDASIIIASEPVWAALVATFALGETMSNVDMTGAALITASGLGNELNWFEKFDSMIENDKKSSISA